MSGGGGGSASAPMSALVNEGYSSDNGGGDGAGGGGGASTSAGSSSIIDDDLMVSLDPVKAKIKCTKLLASILKTNRLLKAERTSRIQPLQRMKMQQEQSIKRILHKGGYTNMLFPDINIQLKILPKTFQRKQLEASIVRDVIGDYFGEQSNSQRDVLMARIQDAHASRFLNGQEAKLNDPKKVHQAYELVFQLDQVTDANGQLVPNPATASSSSNPQSHELDHLPPHIRSALLQGQAAALAMSSGGGNGPSSSASAGVGMSVTGARPRRKFFKLVEFDKRIKPPNPK